MKRFREDNLGPTPVYDQWLAGLNSDAGSICASVNFWTACNITLKDAKLTKIAYMSEPHWNADERNGDQTGIKFGGDGAFRGNRVIANLVINMLTVGISSNNSGNNALIASNVVVNTHPEFGGDGIAIFGSQATHNVVVNNTVVGYKRAICCESAYTTIGNNICKSAPKTGPYMNSGRPQADILINGAHAATGNRTYTNLLARNLLIKQGGGVSMDMGNKSGDPTFVDEQSRDFHLRPGSPYFGAGTYPGFDLIDKDGRAMTRPYSIGAYGRKGPTPDATGPTAPLSAHFLL